MLGGDCIPYGSSTRGLAEAGSREGCRDGSAEGVDGSPGAHDTHLPREEGRGKVRATSGGCPGMWGPQSRRRYCRETMGPTWKTGVTSWPGVRSLTLPKGGARYSIMRGKGRKLGHPPDPLRTLDFGVPQSGPNAPHSPRVSGPRSGRGGNVARPRTGNPPSFRSGATRGRRGTVVSQSFPRPPQPCRGRAALPEVGRENGLGKGSSVRSFS